MFPHVLSCGSALKYADHDILLIPRIQFNAASRAANAGQQRQIEASDDEAKNRGKT